jgi:hypothetical protein
MAEESDEDAGGIRVGTLPSSYLSKGVTVPFSLNSEAISADAADADGAAYSVSVTESKASGMYLVNAEGEVEPSDAATEQSDEVSHMPSGSSNDVSPSSNQGQSDDMLGDGESPSVGISVSEEGSPLGSSVPVDDNLGSFATPQSAATSHSDEATTLAAGLRRGTGHQPLQGHSVPRSRLQELADETARPPQGYSLATGLELEGVGVPGSAARGGLPFPSASSMPTFGAPSAPRGAPAPLTAPAGNATGNVEEFNEAELGPHWLRYQFLRRDREHAYNQLRADFDDLHRKYEALLRENANDKNAAERQQQNRQQHAALHHAAAQQSAAQQVAQRSQQMDSSRNVAQVNAQAQAHAQQQVQQQAQS